MNPTTLLSASGIVGLFGLAVFLIVWLLRVWIRQNNSAELREEALFKQIAEGRREVSELRGVHSNCERKLNILYVAMNRAGVEIPAAVWEQ
jgi:hypothetical protein